MGIMIIEQKKVKGLGIVAQSDGNLYTNVLDLKTLISPRDEAYARIHSSIGHAPGRGTKVSMIVDYLKGEHPVLVRNGMNKGLASSLVEVNSKSREDFYIEERYFSTGTVKQYEKASKTAEREVRSGIAPEKRKAVVCPSREIFRMSLTENKEHLMFVFQDMAQKYLNKLGEPISFSLIDADIVDRLNGTIQNYLFFSDIGNGGGLKGDDDDADDCYLKARRVCASAVKLVYSHSQLNKLAQLVREVEEGDIPASKLAKFLREFK